MAYNINHGWGRIIANALAQKQRTGKVLITCGASNVLFQELNEIYSDKSKIKVDTTLQASIDQSVGEHGDTIFVAPNHTENITEAGGLDTGTDTAGLTIIGLGDADERPLFTFTTIATADFDIGSNGVTLENLRFDLTGVDALAGPIDVNDSGCTIRNCEFITADSGGQAITTILTDANADKMVVEGCKFIGSTDAGSTSAIRIVGGDYTEIKDNYFEGAYKLDTGAIEVTTTLAGFLVVDGNTIKNLTTDSTGAMKFILGTNGHIVDNRLGILSGTTPVTAAEVGANPNGLLFGGNYYSAVTTVTAGTLL